MLAVYPARVHPKLRQRARKGIPDSYRVFAWKRLLLNHPRLQVEKGLYERLSEVQEVNKDVKWILKDITRTFPHHVFFKDRFGKGQKTLFKVLVAISAYFKETGYVQGMGYIVGLLLTYMDEEETFWAVVSLFNNYNLKRYFLPKMPGLNVSFYVLLRLMKENVPKVHARFMELGFEPASYAS